MRAATTSRPFSILQPSSWKLSRGVYLIHSLPHKFFPRRSSRELFLPAYPCGQSPCQMSTASDDHPYTDFFRYTSGRWLWDEEQQLRDRFRPSNVLELQRVAAESIGANSCVAMTKLAEGSFNKTFRLIMDNGSVVIARIPHPIQALRIIPPHPKSRLWTFL